MQFDAVRAIVEGVPNMTPDDGKVVYDLILKANATNCLELGFAHGTGSCYMGAALQETGGRLISIDNQSAKDRDPNIVDQLKKAGLEDVVQPIFAPTSYNWELMRLIEEHTHGGVCRPFLDFCYIDGSHQWEIDGFAFTLVDKLLKPGGWVLFDDLYWTLEGSSIKDDDWVRRLPEVERQTPQVQKIYELIVKQHPGYVNCRIVGWWGWAQKNPERDTGVNVLDDIGVRATPIDFAKRILRPLVRRIRPK